MVSSAADLAPAVDELLSSESPLGRRLLDSIARGDSAFGLSGRHARDRLADRAIALCYSAFLGAESVAHALARRPRELARFGRTIETLGHDFDSGDGEPPTSDALRRFAWLAWRVRRDSREPGERLPTDTRTLGALLDRVAASDGLPVSSDASDHPAR